MREKAKDCALNRRQIAKLAATAAGSQRPSVQSRQIALLLNTEQMRH